MFPLEFLSTETGQTKMLGFSNVGTTESEVVRENGIIRGFKPLYTNSSWGKPNPETESKIPLRTWGILRPGEIGNYGNHGNSENKSWDLWKSWDHGNSENKSWDLWKFWDHGNSENKTFWILRPHPVTLRKLHPVPWNIVRGVYAWREWSIKLVQP